MCKILYPVFRLGQVLDSGIDLDPEQAFGIGNKLWQSAEAIGDSIFRAVKDDLAELGAAASKIPESQAKIRIDPTIVIDFKRFSIKWGNYKIESRFCVTVCQNEKQSKIWIRLNLLENDSDPDLVSDFFEFAEKAAKIFLREVCAQYQEQLRSFDSSCELKQVYEIDIRAGNDNEPKVETYYNNRFAEFEPDNNSLDATIPSVTEALGVIDPENKWAEKKDRFKPNYIPNDNARVFGVTFERVPRNETGGYDYNNQRELYLVCYISYEDDRAKIVGAGYDPMGSDAKPQNSLAHYGSTRVSEIIGELY